MTTLSPGESIIIEKRNFRGDLVVSYPGWLVQAQEPILVLARWDQPSVSTPYTVFAEGDILLEAFFRQLPYNVFALYDGNALPTEIDWSHYLAQAGADAYRRLCRILSMHALKGYYINFSRPVQFDPEQRRLTWYDMDLDIWIPAFGNPILLDEDAYKKLQLAETDHELAEAIAQVRNLFLHLPDSPPSSIFLPCYR